MSDAPPAIFISAGEASGDQHGAAIAVELRTRLGDVRLLGVGGPDMEAAGVELMAGIEELAIMGAGEVLKRLPFLLRLRRRIERRFARGEVDLFLPVDYPGLNLRLARAACRSGTPVLYFIAPQVWAWREGRARELAAYCDRVLSILPFEGDLLARYGVDARFVGHPLLDHARDAIGEARPADAPLVGIFPGSREQEVARILPVFAEAAWRLKQRRPALELLVARPPHLPEALYASCGLRTANAPEVISAASVAMTKSGTITLELALADVPMVVGYRTSRLEWAIGRRVVRVPSIVLVNLVAGERVVPEFLQDDMTPERLVSAIEPLLDAHAPERRDMLRGYELVRNRLGEPGCARRVVDQVEELLA